MRVRLPTVRRHRPRESDTGGARQHSLTRNSVIVLSRVSRRRAEAQLLRHRRRHRRRL